MLELVGEYQYEARVPLLHHTVELRLDGIERRLDGAIVSSAIVSSAIVSSAIVSSALIASSAAWPRVYR